MRKTTNKQRGTGRIIRLLEGAERTQSATLMLQACSTASLVLSDPLLGGAKTAKNGAEVELKIEVNMKTKKKAIQDVKRECETF